MLSFGLRLLLLAGSVLTFTYILYSVRKAKMQIDYCVFWLLFGVLPASRASCMRPVRSLAWSAL